MRSVFVGGSSLAVMAARLMIEHGEEVVIIERERERIEALSGELDCGFLHGDGSKPAVLKEADPEQTDMLICVTNHDQSNIIASLVGRSQGFKRVITSISDPELQHICIELGLEDTIVPDRTIASYLLDLSRGVDSLEFSAMLKGDARLFTFAVRPEDVGPLAKLQLPPDTRTILVNRDDEFVPVDDELELQEGDEVALVTRESHLEELADRWA